MLQEYITCFRRLACANVVCSVDLMSYMGDRKSSKGPMEHVKKMTRNLMLAPAGLRDEAYMQLCKQTNKNPKE